MSRKQFYTVSELQKMFGKSRLTIYNWIEAGRFAGAFQISGPGSDYLVPVESAEAVRKEEVEKLKQQLEDLTRFRQAVPA